MCNPLLSARGRCHCDQLCVSCFLSTLSKENATAVSVTTCVEFSDGAYGGNIPFKTLCSVFKIVKDNITLHWNMIGWRKEKTTFTPGLKLFSISRWIAANTLFVVDYQNPSKAELPQLGSWWYHTSSTFIHFIKAQNWSIDDNQTGHGMCFWDNPWMMQKETGVKCDISVEWLAVAGMTAGHMAAPCLELMDGGTEGRFGKWWVGNDVDQCIGIATLGTSST